MGGTTASLAALANRNFTVVLALILIASPVAGLRPIRAARCAFTSLPRPGIVNSPLLPGLSRRGLDQQVEERRDLLGRYLHLLGHVPDHLRLGHLGCGQLGVARGLRRRCGLCDAFFAAVFFTAVFLVANGTPFEWVTASLRAESLKSTIRSLARSSLRSTGIQRRFMSPAPDPYAVRLGLGTSLGDLLGRPLRRRSDGLLGCGLLRGAVSL